MVDPHTALCYTAISGIRIKLLVSYLLLNAFSGRHIGKRNVTGLRKCINRLRVDIDFVQVTQTSLVLGA